MAILVEWDNKAKSAVLVEFESIWTWDELDEALDQMDQMIAGVTHRVDVIVDLEGSKIPKDFMSAAKRLLENPEQRDNEGARIIIGANKTMQAVYSTVKSAFGERIAGRDLLFAPSLDDARAILRGMR